VNVLYLHGFASGPDGTKAAALRRHLQTRGIELTAPDLNEPAFSTLTVSRSIARVEEITRAAAPWDLVGSSLGGLTAAFFAARFPQRVRRVVLLCPAFDLEKLFAASLGETEMARWRETGHYPFADASGEMTPVHWQMFADLSAYAGFPPVAHPTLVIHGRQDTTVPLAFSRAFAKTSPLVTLEEIDDDHRMSASVDAVCRRIGDFLLDPS